MFAVLHASATTPLDVLVEVAQAFTPRFQVLGAFVLLDVGGLSALFGTPEELGGAIRQACPACRAVALGSTAAAAMLLACGREGFTVLDPIAEKAALVELPIDVLIEVTIARLSGSAPEAAVALRAPGPDAAAPLPPATGWRHPRDTHQAHHTRRPRARAASVAEIRQAVMALQQCGATLRRWGILRLGGLAALPRADVHARLGELGASWQRLACGEDDEPLVPWLAEPVFEELVELEWPIEGFEPLSFVLARLLEPLSTRLELADRGAVAIRTALHLVNRQSHVRVIPLPAPMRDPKTLRTLVLLDLESHPPSAAIDRVQVRVEPTPGRVLQWTLFDRAQPAPEQVATLVARLTALMGDGHVGSPALVDAWRPGAFAIAPFAPPADAPIATDAPSRAASETSADLRLAFRRFRLPIPVRVRVDDGRPVRVTTDRRGITGGVIVQAAGPWRTSGEWWISDRVPGGQQREGVELREGDDRDRDCSVSSGLPEPHDGDQSREGSFRSRSASLPSRDGSYPSRHGSPWDRDEWDIAMADGTVYRLFIEREVGQWFLEGVFD
ncbi:MAG TPA: hypothetical protein VL263_19315 [Vicinamibacterales bacterium]|nr:hypothetical protein [Vicinamibacterales bacterium]